MHSIHGYIIGNKAFCNMLVIRHVKFTAICRFYTNIISYMRADILTVIYACRWFITYASYQGLSTFKLRMHIESVTQQW